MFGCSDVYHWMGRTAKAVCLPDCERTCSRSLADRSYRRWRWLWPEEGIWLEAAFTFGRGMSRLAADRSPLRRAHGAVHRGEELLRRVRARGDDLEDLRGHAVLLPAAWAFCRRCDRPLWSTVSSRMCLVAPGYGVRGRGAEAHFDQPGGKRGLNVIRRPEVLAQRASRDGRSGNRPSSFEDLALPSHLRMTDQRGRENDAVA